MAKNKLTHCKVCGAEVAKTAKTCPSCGATIKKKHPVLIGLIAVFVILIIAAIAGGGDGSEKVTDTSGTVQSSSSTDKEKTEFAVGETAELNDVSVTLLNVTESAGSAFNTPTDGNVFVLCEFEIANHSKKDINVSSMMSFEAYCDNYTCNYSLSALLEKGNKNQLDGTVASGKNFNGVIGYEVPANWKELEIRFTPDFWNGKDIVFVASK